jgi:hypothetical protein
MGLDPRRPKGFMRIKAKRDITTLLNMYMRNGMWRDSVELSLVA